MNKLFFILIFYSSIAWSHPVTFKDGQEVQFNQFSNMTKLSYTYSFTNQQSLGVSYLKMNSNDFKFIDYNYLIKRWNKLHSQANLYTGISLGVKNQDQAASGFFMEADWESRRHYISSKINFIDSDPIFKNRIGIAPYLAKYEQLNTWIMVEHVQVNHMNLEEINLLARFYYKNYLWELGWGSKNNLLFNFMIHY